MKRIFIPALMATLLISNPIYAQEKKDTYSGGKSHFTLGVRGGFFFPDDKDYQRIYGRWSNDIYFFDLGWYPLKNLAISGTVGFYVENSHTIGTITPSFSGERVRMALVPLDAGLLYRFNFRKNQLLVPEIGAEYDSIFFNERAGPGTLTKGWKKGYSAHGGLLLLLDRLDPDPAWNLLMDYGIHNTYLALDASYGRVGNPDHGLNLSGMTYTLGLVFEF